MVSKKIKYKMEDMNCISCKDNLEPRELNTLCRNTVESYARMFEICFNIKVPGNLKYICGACALKLEHSAAFKKQIDNNIAMLHGTRDAELTREEHLDETIFDDEGRQSLNDPARKKPWGEMCKQDSIICKHCVTHFSKPNLMKLQEGSWQDRLERSEKSIPDGDQNSADEGSFPCHFCDKIFMERNACYTHVKMSHGLKLTTDNMVVPFKATRLERQLCHICNKGFKQKQILNRHLLRKHGLQVAKRKAFICPLCDDRVSYGSHFEKHLLQEHDFKPQIMKLQFRNMDDFIIYKNLIQEQTMCRFRKTTSSKPTVEGLRSHFMCSQSGEYVYQGKGIRLPPEGQIYKTGKACPAHMVVTETVDRVLVIFHSTHLGHGACPFYTLRDKKSCTEQKSEDTQVKRSGEVEYVLYKKDKIEKTNRVEEVIDLDEPEAGLLSWVCDVCDAKFVDENLFRQHTAMHMETLPEPNVYHDDPEREN